MTVLSARNFSGIDARTDAGSLYSISPGKTPQATNVYAKGSDYYTRAGVKAILTNPHGGGQSCYTGFPYVKSDGSEWVIYAVGVPGVATGGTIWQVPKAGGTPTEILDATNGNIAFNINASAFHACQGGSYAYLCWGGPNVYRTNLATSAAAAVTSLIPPTSAPVAALTSKPLLSVASAANWSTDTFAGAVTGGPTTLAAAATNYVYQGGLNIVQKAVNAINNSGGYASGYYNQDGTITPGVQTDTVMEAVGANPAIEPAGTEGLPSWSAGVASAWMQFDNPGEGFVFQNGAAAGVSVYYQNPVLSAPNAYRSCSQHYVGFNFYSSDSSSKQGFAITLYCYADAACTNLIGQATKTFVPVFGGQASGQYYDCVLDVSGLIAPIVGVKLFVGGAQTNYPTGHGWVYAANLIWAPIPNGLSVMEGANSLVLMHQEPTGAYFGALNSVRLTYDSGAGNTLNWSASPDIALNVASSTSGGALNMAALIAAGLSMQFVFRQDGATIEYTSSTLTFDSNSTYVGIDVSSTVPAAILASFRYFTIEFIADLTTTVSTAAMFAITGIVSGGNVPIGFNPVTYAYEEVYSVNDFTLSDPIETAYSPASNALTATIDQATGLITFPLFANALADYVRVGRGGGTYDDGLFRVVGTFPKAYDVIAPLSLTDLSIPAGQPLQIQSATRLATGTDIGQTVLIPAPAAAGFTAGLYQVTGTSGTAWILSSSAGAPGSVGCSGTFGGDNLPSDQYNPYVTWAHSSRSLTDNTPDSFLNTALVLQQNRDTIPAGVTYLGYWQGRIYFVYDESVALSWSLIADAQNGIYTSLTNDLTTDPSYTIKGFQDDLNPGDNDAVRNAIASGSQLLILKGRSAGLMMGYNPSNFTLQTYLTAAGNGCIAPKAAVTYNNQIFFLGLDDVYVFDGDNVERLSKEIGPLLHPSGDAGETTVSASAAALSAMFVYEGRLHLLAPIPGGSNNQVDWVYDFIEQAWTQWEYPVGMTSACSLVASSDGDACYYGGLDGMLYAISPGTADYTTLGGAAVPIEFSVTSRGLGEEISQYSPSMEVGLAALEASEATEYFCSMGLPPGGATITLFAYADGDSSPGSPTYQSTTYVFTTGGKQKIRWSLAPGLIGTQLFAGVSGSVSGGQVSIRYLALDVSKAGPSLSL